MIYSYDMKKLGQKLKSFRSELGLTQLEVTELTNISRDTLRRIENGHVVPRYDTIIILSKIYRFNLMKLFNHYTIDEPLMKYYELIDECIATNDIHLIEELYDELKDIFHEKGQKFQLVIVHEIEQMLKLLESIILLYENELDTIDEKKLQKIKELITKGIGIRHEHYNLNHYREYKYSFIELRSLLVYALAKDDNLYEQTDLLLYLIDKFDMDSKDPKEVQIILKLYYNISYNYYRLEKDQLSLDYAIKGIKMCQTHHSTFLRAHLLARKGIAMYYLEMPDYHMPLCDALNLLKIDGQNDLYQSFYKTFVDYHNIFFDKNGQFS